jgi:hypothetical protein
VEWGPDYVLVGVRGAGRNGTRSRGRCCEEGAARELDRNSF